MKDLELFQKEFDEIDFIKHPPITIMDVLGQKLSDENLISNWLAFVLDSNINGLKNNKAIKQLLLALENDFIDIENEKVISVRREASTNNQKRIDILIECSNTVIVIENKIYSEENGTQTMEYYKYAEKEFKNKENKIYIYLKPNYNSSEPCQKEFKILTYEKLIKSLNEITEIDYKEDEKYKYKYLEEFIRVGAEYMKNEEFEITNVVEFYTKNLKHWENITQEYRKNNINLVNKLENEIKNKFPNGYNFYRASNYMQIFKPKWVNEKYTIHYEVLLYETNFNNLLGFENVKIEVVLHLEGRIPENIKENLKEVGIEKGSNKTSKEYNFKTNIDTSIKTIVDLLIKMDTECCEKIDSIMN